MKAHRIPLVPFQPCPASLALALVCATATGQTLVRDFDATPASGFSESRPREFAPLSANRMLFVAETPTSGQELWVTDGTAMGTALVVDLVPGANGSSVRELTPLGNGLCVFQANVPGIGWEPWCTDGTASGTFLLRDVRPGPDSSSPAALTRVGSQVWFFADDGVHGIEPWISDGTSAGTRLLLDVEPGSVGMSNGAAEIAALGSGAGSTQAVFSARVAGAWELWVSDGTAAGSQSILQTGMTWTQGATNLTTFGSRVAFVGRTTTTQPACWMTDGTAAGTFSTLANTSGALQVAGSRVYFPGYSLATDVELWATDGTIAGTGMVLDLNPGGYPNSGNPGFLGELQGDLIFVGTDQTGPGLFRTDGTAANTVRLSSAAPAGTLGGSNWGVTSNGQLYYEVFLSAVTNGLYRTDGTAAGTTLLTTVDAGEIAAFGAGVLFGGDDGTPIGEELWTSDGTAAGTQIVADIAQGTTTQSSYPTVLGAFQDRVIVSAETPANGREVWLTDGTPTGTTMLVDLVPGPGSSLPSVAASDTRMLIFDSASGDRDPWFSDGTTAGTAQLDILPAGSGFYGTSPAVFGDRFVFAGYLPGTGTEPWVTDGTVAGTFPLGDLLPGSADSYPDRWFPFGGAMLFAAYHPTAGYALWRTDGTAAGTSMLTSLSGAGGFYEPVEIVEFAGYAWFAAATASQGYELWRTDGTAAGTAMFFDAAPGAASSRPTGLTAIGDRLVMQVVISGATRLLATDGTLAGSQILTFAANEIVGPYALNDSTAAFVLHPAITTNPHQLWRTDGTNAGTSMVRTFGYVNQYPAPRRIGEGRILFSAFESATGVELWTSDGTVAGTVQLSTLAPAQPALGEWQRAGERIVFSGDDGVHGIELLAMPFAATGDRLFERYGSGCPGTGGLVPAISHAGPASITAGAFGLTLDDALANSVAIFALGQRRGAQPLPGGCVLWLDGALGLAVVPTDVQGSSVVPLPVTSALLGTRFDAQFLVVDPAGSAFGFLSSSDAAEFVFGP